MAAEEAAEKRVPYPPTWHQTHPVGKTAGAIPSAHYGRYLNVGCPLTAPVQ
jgi:hypothetical protein